METVPSFRKNSRLIHIKDTAINCMSYSIYLIDLLCYFKIKTGRKTCMVVLVSVLSSQVWHEFCCIVSVGSDKLQGQK